MNYFDLYSSYPDSTIAAAWDSQVKEADNTPWLADTITNRGDDLFARFTACYAELRALPRSARRALQRRIARSGELAATLPEYLQRGGRRLQHRMAWSLAGAALLLALGQGVGSAATITVTTNNPNSVADGQCSLIEAIVNANNDAATHPDCAAGNGADTIVLPANANVILSAALGTTYGQGGLLQVGLPPITSRITIEGNGATIARQGNAPAFGLIWVKVNSSSQGVSPTPGNLTLRNVTLTGGSVFGLLNDGTLSIENSIISGNTGISGGGGVNSSGILNIENSTISGNRGGGVGNGGTLTIANSVISGNTSNFGDGGVSNGGTLTIANSVISGNTSNFGGGGVSNFGTLTLENSTISGNRVNQGGGGVSNHGGTVAITNSTISGNIANDGGGVLNSQSCDYYYNSCTGILTLNNSLIAGNQAAVAPEIENSAATVNANNFNLFGANGNAGVTGFTPGPTDIVPGVPLAQILGPLQDNGGPTQTHALVAVSPAINAGNPNGCRDSLGVLLNIDQRGFPRPINGTCDVGSYEVQVDLSGNSIAPLPLGGQTQYGDLNGDGRADLIFQGLDNTFWVSLSTGAGFTDPTPWVQHGGGFLKGQAQFADLNGDGKADLIFQGWDNTFWVSLSTGAGFTSPTPWIQHGGLFLEGQAHLVDLNGDGKADLIFQGRDNTFWISLSTGTGFTSPTPWVQHGGGFLKGQAQFADLNGDGKVDLIYQGGDNTFWVSLSTGAGFTDPTPWIQHGGTFIPGQAQYADLNGDGKADLIFQGWDNTFWVSFSTGAGFTDPTPWIQHGGLFLEGQAHLVDLNGDGKADLIFQGWDNTFWVSLSTGAGFTDPTPWIQHGGLFLEGQAHLVDLNGDGKADLIFQGRDNTFWISLSTGAGFTAPAPEF